MRERFTRPEVVRILGVGERQLNYWEKLRLVRPGARQGQRLYNFRDLVALRTIQGLTSRGVPAYRLKRAVEALERQLGESERAIWKLRVLSNGKEVVVVPPAAPGRPVNPLTGQFVLDFWTREISQKIRTLGERSAEDWFALGTEWQAASDTLPLAVQAFEQAVRLAPDWVEAHTSLGAARYQQGRPEEAAASFRRAIALDPRNAEAHFNLACVLEEAGDSDLAVTHWQAALRLFPRYPEAHFNLAVAYEKRGEQHAAAEHWAEYLRLDPSGPWADYARARRREGRRLIPLPGRRKE